MKQTLALLVLVLCASICRAERFYPMIMAVRPVAVQAGATCECEFESRYNLHGAYQVMVTGGGVVGEVAGEVDPPAGSKKRTKRSANSANVNRLKVRFKTAADALPGMRDVRLITPQGASHAGPGRGDARSPSSSRRPTTTR